MNKHLMQAIMYVVAAALLVFVFRFSVRQGYKAFYEPMVKETVREMLAAKDTQQ